ncbi:MAG: Hint domain-containing protein [Marinosulfonomonas sp.]
MAVINGTNKNDILVGTPEADQIDGKGGDDQLYGNAGDDDILGGNGSDEIFGGAGDDTIDGGNAADTIDGGLGDDTIDGGDGDDFIDSGAGDDTVLGGSGQDLVYAGSGNDTVDLGRGDDQVFAGEGDDTLLGGQGNDSLHGEDGQDTILGGKGDDELFGEEGDDILFGQQGNDELYGGAGDDLLNGGKNDDQLFGGDGDDNLIVQDGNDQAFGGFGNDTFFVSPGDHKIVGGEDPDGNDIDVLDLSGAGNYTINYTGPESGTIQFLNANGQVYRRASFKEIERVICFTPGTGIATMEGQRPVEDLAVGDRIFTRDNGAQEIRWIGRKKITLGSGTLSQKLQPILIRKGALGYGLPERDTLVSPNHRVLLANKTAQLYFDEPEVLVAAKHLVGMPGVEHWITSEVEYIHFLCDHHEIVLSNGAWTETFQPGDFSIAGLGDPQREEIYTLFPELRDREKSSGFAAARRSLRRYEAELLER